MPRDRTAWVFPAALTAALTVACGGPETAGRAQVAPAQLTLGYGQSQPLRLTFQPLFDLDKLHGTPTVFVHLLHPTEKLVRTFDHALPGPWLPGQEQSYEIDLYQSVLAEALPAGSYRLSIGLYDDEYGYRWMLDTGGEELGRREYVVGGVEVPEHGRHPRFAFSGGWRPAEKMPNRQVLARRCLVAPAALDVSDAPGDGSVRLLLYVPPPPSGGDTALRVGSDCGTEAQDLDAGRHWLDFPLAGETAQKGCQILFQPAAEGERPCLEVLAWRPQ